MVLFKHNLLRPTEAQLMRGVFRETLLRIEQGVMLSCSFAEWKVRRAPCVLRIAVVSQSSGQVRQEACVPRWNNHFHD